MDILKSSVKAPVYSPAAMSAAMVEGIIKLPEDVRASSVIGCSARFMDLQATAQHEAVAVEGTVEFSVVYAMEDSQVDSVTGSNPFSHRFRAPGVEEYMQVAIRGSLASPDAKIVAADRVAVEAVVELEAEGEGIKEYEIVSDTQDEDIQIQQDMLYWFEEGLKEKTVVNVRDDVSIGSMLPEVHKILQTSNRVMVLDILPGEKEIGVSGRLQVDVLYSSLTVPCVKTTLDVPFTAPIAVPEHDYSMEFIAKGKAAHVSVNAYEDNSGRTNVLTVEAPVQLELRGYVQRGEKMVTDAYGIDKNVELTLSTLSSADAPVRMERNIDVFGEVMQAGVLTDCDSEPIAIGEAIVDGYSIEDGNLHINGRIKIQAFYSDQEGELHSENLEAAYDGDVQWEGFGPEGKISVSAQCAAANMVRQEGRWQVKARLGVAVENRLCVEHTVVSDMSISDQPVSKNAPVVLCVASDGDTLWSIAKRCRVNVDSLRAFNPAVGDSLKRGQKLVAVRKI